MSRELNKTTHRGKETYVQPLLTRHRPLVVLTGKSGEKTGDKDPTTDKTTDKDPTTDKTTDKDPTTDKTTDKDPLSDKTQEHGG